MLTELRLHFRLKLLFALTALFAIGAVGLTWIRPVCSKYWVVADLRVHLDIDHSELNSLDDLGLEVVGRDEHQGLAFVSIESPGTYWSYHDRMRTVERRIDTYTSTLGDEFNVAVYGYSVSRYDLFDWLDGPVSPRHFKSREHWEAYRASRR